MVNVKSSCDIVCTVLVRVFDVDGNNGSDIQMVMCSIHIGCSSCISIYSSVVERLIAALSKHAFYHVPTLTPPVLIG